MRPLAFLLAAAAAASALAGGAETWPRLAAERAAWADADEQAVARAAAEHARLPPAPFEFFAERLTASDRYYVHANLPGRRLLVDERLLVGEETIVRMFAGYALLPAVQVLSPHEATVVLALDADPEELGLRYVSVDERPGRPSAAVARIAQ